MRFPIAAICLAQLLLSGAVSGVRLPRSATGNLFFGDFSQVFLAEWGVLELVVDPYTQSKSGIIQVTAFQSVDVGVRYPGAFSLATTVT